MPLQGILGHDWKPETILFGAIKVLVIQEACSGQ